MTNDQTRAAPDDADDKAPGDPTPEGVAPLLDDLRQLAGEARAYAEAELAFQQARLRVVGGGVRRLALLGLFAFVFAVFALVALTVGLLIALTPLVSALGATAIVAGGLALTGLLCLRGAVRAWRQTLAAVSPGRDAAP
ncbi:phage holin family protein [Novosphingobium piscinae]|uniref:Phage holin family protein n=1 Tax=Novosphingobium piscinae TaxID=1507448 RepID=A0A7X1FZV2_9SPHN|nr:phage holin family protein [Novosphingobium piscinae]MBC2669397.1 phage holin family protein [Novosphingobium piscinae]